MSGSLLSRLPNVQASSVAFTLNGQAVLGQDGDTVLTAVLALSDHVRHSEFSNSPRAGFCWMGACQDCWMQTEDGKRLRACSTPLEPGMALVTRLAGAQA